jgi:hypothetical protein
MSIHIPQAFLHNHGNGPGTGTGPGPGPGSGHSSNYLVNKFSSGHGGGNANIMNFKFDEDTSSYFYNELSKILNTDATSDDVNNRNTNTNTIENVIVSDTMEITDNICLITKEKLHPNHITLNCKHKFNYVPLYNEVVGQKNKQSNVYEVTKLSSNQIKCPYCRIITNKLLPHIPYPSVKVIKNVNSYVTTSYNINPDYFLYAPKCSHATTNNAKTECQKYGVYYETENVLLCPQHYKLYTIKLKTGNKKMTKEVATGTAKGCDDMACCVILKSGKNIGKKCGVRCIDGVGENNNEIKYCKKHYKLYSNT